MSQNLTILWYNPCQQEKNFRNRLQNPTGFGRPLYRQLLKNKYEVRIIDNLENSKEEIIERIKEISGKDVEFFKGDIRNVKCSLYYFV